MQLNPSLSQQPKEHHHLPIKILVAILFFASLGHVTADMYVPSLPAITKALSSNATDIQFTLTAFMLGFSFSHLFYGPLSDRIGRRLPLLIGIGLSILGCIFCLFSTSVSILILGRFIQGTGVAVCNSVGRSLVRDLLTGSHLAKISSHLGMIIIFVTATAPMLGGYLQYYYNWRVVFFFLLVYTTLIWLFTWKTLPETNFYLNPHATKPKILIQNYFTVLKHKTFLGYTLCVSFAYAGLIAYVTNGPFLFQTIVGLTPIQYGWLSLVTGSAIFSSFFFNSLFVLRVGIERLVLLGSSLMLAGGSLMVFLAALGFLNTFVVMLPVAIFCMGVGLTFANGSAGAFQPFAKLAGSAGALFGCIQTLGGVAASAVVAKLHFNNQIPLALIFIASGLFSFISWKFLATKEISSVIPEIINNTSAETVSIDQTNKPT